MSVVKIAQREPVEDVVELLEQLLARAKSGEIVCICAVAQSARPEYHLAGGPDLSMLGAMTLATQRLTQDLFVDNYD